MGIKQVTYLGISHPQLWGINKRQDERAQRESLNNRYERSTGRMSSFFVSIRVQSGSERKTEIRGAAFLPCEGGPKMGGKKMAEQSVPAGGGHQAGRLGVRLLVKGSPSGEGGMQTRAKNLKRGVGKKRLPQKNLTLIGSQGGRGIRPAKRSLVRMQDLPVRVVDGAAARAP